MTCKWLEKKWENHFEWSFISAWNCHLAMSGMPPLPFHHRQSGDFPIGCSNSAERQEESEREKSVMPSDSPIMASRWWKFCSRRLEGNVSHSMTNKAEMIFPFSPAWCLSLLCRYIERWSLRLSWMVSSISSSEAPVGRFFFHRRKLGPNYRAIRYMCVHIYIFLAEHSSSHRYMVLNESDSTRRNSNRGSIGVWWYRIMPEPRIDDGMGLDERAQTQFRNCNFALSNVTRFIHLILLPVVTKGLCFLR